MMKAMVDVANIKKNLRQIEADKLQIMYELEAEKENRIGKESMSTVHYKIYIEQFMKFRHCLFQQQCWVVEVSIWQ